MGALDMGLTEEELPPLVDAWRQSNPNIVKFWWDVDRAVMEAVKFKHTTSEYGLTFSCRSGMLFITLPSGRKLAYTYPFPYGVRSLPFMTIPSSRQNICTAS